MPPLLDTEHSGGRQRPSQTSCDSLCAEKPSFLRYFHFPNESSFCECTSPYGFENPFADTAQCTPARVNEHDLNLHLGQEWITSDLAYRVHDVITNNTLLNTLYSLYCYGEGLVLRFLRWIVPDVVIRTVLITIGWKLIYLPLHRRWLQRSTGLHSSLSLECHALSTVMFLGHFVIHSVPRIRFGLSLLTAARPSAPTHRVQHLANGGIMIHPRCNNQNNSHVTLLWIHAGAYLSGCPRGNVGVADRMVDKIGCKVYIPKYRLAPEYCMADVMADIHHAYEWLRQEQGANAPILLGGWSAGAALCTRLLQRLRDDKNTTTLPLGAVLMSPFCRYEPLQQDSSLFHYSRHDWLVTRGIIRVGQDCLHPDTFWGGDATPYAPLCHEWHDLPPLCVLVSEHEAVYEETCELIHRARQAQVNVTVAQWRYMAHGWYMFDGLLPEGERALNYACEWIKKVIEKASL